MSDEKKTHGGRMGFMQWLTLLFIALKLTGHINWPWVWVLAPLWVPIVIAVVVAVLCIVGAFLVAVFREMWKAE